MKLHEVKKFRAQASDLVITPKVMESAHASAAALRKQIEVTETELGRLKALLAHVEAGTVPQKIGGLSIEEENASPMGRKWPLKSEEYKRYGRQMIVPSVGIQGILFLLSLMTLGLLWHSI